MTKWCECKLADAPLEIIDGDRGENYPKQTEFFESGHCLFLNAKNVTSDGFNFNERAFITKDKDETLRKGKLQRNDVVLTTRGTVGNVAFFNKNVPYNNIRINSGMVVIRSNPGEILPEFTHQLFKFLRKDFDLFATGSAQPQLPIRDLKNITVSIPSLEEQQGIVAVLSSLDGKIDLLHRQNKTFESLASTLWRKIFIEDANPEWENGRLSDIADINPYRELKKGAQATYLDMSNMPTNCLFPLEWESREYSGGMKFNNGDTLLARITPCLENGKTAHVNFLEDGEVAAGSTEYIVLSPKRSNCTEWLYFLARHDDFRDFAIQNMTGTSGRQRVSGETVAQYEMAIPSGKAFEEFHAFAEPVFKHIKQNSLQIRVLRNTRDTVLPKLISGEVKVYRVRAKD